MGRLTVSLPDDLQAALDTYAQQHGKAVSQVVADALHALLDAPTVDRSPPPTSVPAPAPGPGPGPDAPAGADPAVRLYLEDLYQDLSRLLGVVQDLAASSPDPLPHNPPYQLAAPPWQR